ncbi:phage tail tube protein, partial [Enterococcus spodopteracolus]
MKLKTGVGRKVWHRIVSSDGTKQWVGHATVTDIVAGSGAAEVEEAFGCTITFNMTPVEGTPGSGGSNSEAALNSTSVSNKANKK